MDKRHTPQRLYDVFQPLIGLVEIRCLSAWHGHQALPLVFPMYIPSQTTIHQLSVAIEEGGGKALFGFVSLLYTSLGRDDYSSSSPIAL